MHAFQIEDFKVTGGTACLLENGVIEVTSSKDGAQLALEGAPGHPGGVDWSKYGYLIYDIETLEEFSLGIHMFVYENKQDKMINVTTGILPRLKTRICVPLELLNGKTLFVERTPAALKMVVHGNSIELDRMTRFVITSYPCHKQYVFRISNIHLSTEPPAEYPVPEKKLVDEMGQYIPKDWNGKVKNLADLKSRFEEQLRDIRSDGSFRDLDWNRWGGCAQKRLTQGTGFFATHHDGRRWWLTDPDGCAFFAVGADCCTVQADYRVDMVDKLLTWLPERGGEYKDFFMEFKGFDRRRNKGVSFNFAGANLKRTLGDGWKDDWFDLIRRLFVRYGMNSLGNWSDAETIRRTHLPYVWSLPVFPTADRYIFRDFPDVFSPSYRASAAEAAEALRGRAEDPYMIGYFLRNEPQWAFVNDLIIANEVLKNPEDTFCRRELIGFLKGRYGGIAALNTAWGTDFTGVEAFEKPMKDLVGDCPKSEKDMRAFSVRMYREYVGVPSQACKKADKNHLNLGMRWAWISSPDMVAGWENFDVFSMNCYDDDPNNKIKYAPQAGVNKPILIGEFHFGALDGGLPATGLCGVADQKSKGRAWRYYIERAAANPYCVGAHWFQLYDQFALGRFDGENYNIGLLDVCSQPYEEMLQYVRESAKVIYDVADGRTEPFSGPVERIPYIGY